MIGSESGHEPHSSEALEDPLEPGTAMEVYSPFNGAWVAGFVIAAVAPGGYRLRRVSDGLLLPKVFPESDVRVQW